MMLPSVVACVWITEISIYLTIHGVGTLLTSGVYLASSPSPPTHNVCT